MKQSESALVNTGAAEKRKRRSKLSAKESKHRRSIFRTEKEWSYSRSILAMVSRRDAKTMAADDPTPDDLETLEALAELEEGTHHFEGETGENTR